jgi:hypothetical protein
MAIQKTMYMIVRQAVNSNPDGNIRLCVAKLQAKQPGKDK